MLEFITALLNTLASALLGVIISVSVIFGINTDINTQDTKQPAYQPKQEIQKITVKESKNIKQKENIQKEGDDMNKEKVISTTTQQKDIVRTQPISTIQNIISQFIPKQIDEDLNKKTREALVNILCTTASGGVFNSITGSGVIIDSRGVILTNAHVAQYFLLENYKYENSMDCIIRNGSPASPAYDAEILYISPSWIKENAHQITKDMQKGTGENDFALLRITKSINSSPLPKTFTYLSPELVEQTAIQGTPVLIAGYPAGFLGGIAIQKNLWPVSTISKIIERYTFSANSIDLIALGGNIAAQPGSSGGAVVSMTTKNLLGIVVTSTQADSTNNRELNAVTVFHINRSISGDTGTTLLGLLDGNIEQKASVFNNTIAQTLTTLLEQELDK